MHLGFKRQQLGDPSPALKPGSSDNRILENTSNPAGFNGGCPCLLTFVSGMQRPRKARSDLAKYKMHAKKLDNAVRTTTPPIPPNPPPLSCRLQ
jgi:hypothetical protein